MPSMSTLLLPQVDLRGSASRVPFGVAGALRLNPLTKLVAIDPVGPRYSGIALTFNVIQ